MRSKYFSLVWINSSQPYFHYMSYIPPFLWRISSFSSCLWFTLLYFFLFYLIFIVLGYLLPYCVFLNVIYILFSTLSHKIIQSYIQGKDTLYRRHKYHANVRSHYTIQAYLVQNTSHGGLKLIHHHITEYEKSLLSSGLPLLPVLSNWFHITLYT